MPSKVYTEDFDQPSYRVPGQRKLTWLAIAIILLVIGWVGILRPLKRSTPVRS